MLLIDLNHCYFKIIANDEIWCTSIDELQSIVPDKDETVIVRKGQETAIMPLASVCRWMFPYGRADIDHVGDRRLPVRIRISRRRIPYVHIPF